LEHLHRLPVGEKRGVLSGDPLTGFQSRQDFDLAVRSLACFDNAE